MFGRHRVRLAAVYSLRSVRDFETDQTRIPKLGERGKKMKLNPRSKAPEKNYKLPGETIVTHIHGNSSSPMPAIASLLEFFKSSDTIQCSQFLILDIISPATPSFRGNWPPKEVFHPSSYHYTNTPSWPVTWDSTPSSRSSKARGSHLGRGRLREVIPTS